MQRFFLIMGTLAFFTLYALTLSTESNASLSTVFWTLVFICVVLILIMFGVILHYIFLILRDKHNHVFGSQIARKLSLMFTLVAVLPSLALLGISAQFISHNIRHWYTAQTKQAIDRSLELSKSALNKAADRSMEQAAVVRHNIMTTALAHSDLSPALQTRQAQAFAHLAIWDLQNKTVELQVNPKRLLQPRLDETTLKALLRNGTAHSLENINHITYARGWLRLPDIGGKPYALFFRQSVPEDIAKDAALMESANARYAELMLAKTGMQTFFLIALILAALLAMLLALSAALYFARRFVEPILYLATGAKAVAQGNFDQRIGVIRKDELGKLTKLFNHMSEQLAIAKRSDEQHRAEQEAARHYLERVLNSLSAGVITFDAAGRLNTFNRSAEIILDMPLSDLMGKTLPEWQYCSPKHSLLAETLSVMLRTEEEEQPAETAYTGADESRILLGKAIRLPEENGNGIVLVFDNITTLVLAQKEAAWREVAKRLAHEIRNPLTPIQLSAERLAWKLGGKLSDSDEKTLTKSTDTIIKQVAALKEMVEAFRNYARAPSLNMSDIDLNKLVAEVLVLYESTPCKFTAEFSKMPMLLKADTTAMRQVLHNLFKNAAEAAEAAESPEAFVRTETDESGSLILTVANNGRGFSKQMLQNAFEPYMTDKPTGTGLGLSVVRKIVEEHNGKIVLANREDGGACVTLKFTPEPL